MQFRPEEEVSADTKCNELEVTSIKYKCTGKDDNKVYFWDFCEFFVSFQEDLCKVLMIKEKYQYIVTKYLKILPLLQEILISKETQ